MYLLNSPYDKITIIMIRQSNASILVHNKAINVVLQTGRLTRQPYNMLCHCITSILIQTYRLHKSATPHGFLLFLGSRTAVLLLNLGNCILLQTPPFAGYGDVWVHCVTRLMKLNLTFHLVFKKKLAIKSSVEVLNFHIFYRVYIALFDVNWKRQYSWDEKCLSRNIFFVGRQNTEKSFCGLIGKKPLDPTSFNSEAF